MSAKIMRRVLGNGLTVILKEVRTAPVISWWMLYRVGSRNEPSGKTGLSHWVEHMMFKGTEKFPHGVLDKTIDRAGGQWNAMTSMDYTLYYETLPADRIHIALEAEADRMVNARFDPKETESERTVILSERHGAENRPLFWLNEEIRAAAFRVHGYHHEIIGDEVDLKRITRDELVAHYRQHYVPGNAVALAVGDFVAEEMFAKIEALYGGIAAAPVPEVFVRPEPPQLGERRVMVERPGKTAFFEVVYRAPEATQDDWFALEILDSILSGASGVSDNKTSRLYKALVETEIAASVSGGMMATIDPYLYNITITLRDGRSHQEAEQRLFAEIDRVCEGGVTEAELSKVKKQARAAFAYSAESVTEQAYWLARAAALHDFDWFSNYRDRLAAVTPEQIITAARHYLRPQNRTVGWLIPTGANGASTK